jgi:Helix-turn-helix domain of resolvase
VCPLYDRNLANRVDSYGALVVGSSIDMPRPTNAMLFSRKMDNLAIGRPASIDPAQVRELKAQGLGASEIAKALKIGRASVYRVLEAG